MSYTTYILIDEINTQQRDKAGTNLEIVQQLDIVQWNHLKPKTFLYNPY